MIINLLLGCHFFSVVQWNSSRKSLNSELLERIYSRIMKERFHAEDEKSLHLRFHVQTSGESLTTQQVDNNIIRVTTQAMARSRRLPISSYKFER